MTSSLSHRVVPDGDAVDFGKDAARCQSEDRKRAGDQREDEGISEDTAKPRESQRTGGAGDLLISRETAIQVPTAAAREHRLDHMRPHQRGQAGAERERHRAGRDSPD